jgi:hypothetical protein
MLRTKSAHTCFTVAATLTIMLTPVAHADQGVQARAERVCALGQAGPAFQGSFNVDNLTVWRDANGVITLEKGGVKIGEIGESSYADHTVCLVEVMALISSSEMGGSPSPPAHARAGR